MRSSCPKLLLFAFFLLGNLCARATSLPEWARKGESYMNRKRTNTSYSFKVFKTEDSSLTRLQEGRFYPLLKDLGDQCGISPDMMVLDSLSNGPGEPFTYRILLPRPGYPATVLAQRVDVFSTVDYNVERDPVFEYYQLYAVSEINGVAVFDHFEKGERSKATAALLSAVAPGVGQIYKGHTFKGGVILGSEIALGVTAVTFHARSLYYQKRKEEDTLAPESFHSEEIGLRRLRNITLGAMAGIWAFGIYDAFAKESMPTISVSAPQGGQLTLSPSSVGAGLTLVYHF